MLNGGLARTAAKYSNALTRAATAWALGGGGLVRWDGTRWRYLPSPPRHGLGTELSGLAVISADDIWVVGTKA